MLYFILAVILLAALGVLLWPVRRERLLVVAAGLFFFIAAFGIYFIVGAPQIVPLLQMREQKMAAVKTSLLENSAAVKADPRNLAAWVALGQDFVEARQYAAAANAFKQAVVLSNGDAKLIMAYAKSLILSEEGQVGDRAKKSLEMVLLQEPQHEEARYFLAIRKLQDGNSQEAMQEMKSLYRSLPNDSPLRETIDRQIGK